MSTRKKIWVEAGMLIRGHIRRGCRVLDLHYVEEKGWLSSLFVIEGEVEQLERLASILESLA